MKRTPRREPVQERGRRRCEQVLDAADALFAEVGYEGATTNAIAARAGTAIGSLYQFFPDKSAILHALATRYRDALRLVHESVLTPESARLPLDEAYDRVICALADYHRRHPGFQALFYGSPTSAGLGEACKVLHEECIGRVEAVLAARVPGLDPGRRRLIATINVETLKALLPLTAKDESRREVVLGEIKSLLLGYTREALAAETLAPGRGSC
jgi:AcrR family transcriptional regulator